MKPLTGKFAQIVYHDAGWEDHYRDKFRARRAVALAAVNKGWTFQDCELTLLDPTRAVSQLWLTGSHGQELGRQQAFKRLKGDYEASTGRARQNPAYRSASEARQRIGELAAEAASYPWKGRSGKTDQDVLTALRHLASKAGTDAVDASVRDLSILAGVTVRTVSRSLRRLACQRWIIRVSGPPEAVFGASRAARYKLSSPYMVRQNVTYESLNIVLAESHMWRNGAPVDPGHEVWVQLGKSAMALYRVLDVTPRSARQLARLADVGNRTADRKLPVLAGLGMAAKTDQGWTFGTVSPYEVAKSEGWIGDNSKVEQRRKAIAEDREWWPLIKAGQKRRVCKSCGYPFLESSPCQYCGTSVESAA